MHQLVNSGVGNSLLNMGPGAGGPANAMSGGSGIGGSTYVSQPATTTYVNQPASTYTTTEYVNQPVSNTYTTTEYVNQPVQGTYVSSGSGVQGYETTNINLLAVTQTQI